MSDKRIAEALAAANEKRTRGVTLTGLSDVRREAGALYNFYRAAWKPAEKPNANEARALATLLGLVRDCIVEGELEPRLLALERERRASSGSQGIPLGAEPPGGNGTRPN